MLWEVVLSLLEVRGDFLEPPLYKPRRELVFSTSQLDLEGL